MGFIEELFRDLTNGNRRALSKAITLVESRKLEDRTSADRLLSLLPTALKSRRIGISGSPGAGKSTFIAAYGTHLLNKGHRVAVLAIDPSSPISGGSILGDKTRMGELASDPNAFVRPSSSAGYPGGIAHGTRDAILLCEAAGYDTIMIETVGVGQSETSVSKITDLFVLLALPGSGDELQGIKKGIMELADIILLNKADGNQLNSAMQSFAELQSALQYISPIRKNWYARVLPVSAVARTGFFELDKHIDDFFKSTEPEKSETRTKQENDWIWDAAEDILLENFRKMKTETQVVTPLTSRLSVRSRALDIINRLQKLKIS